MRETFGKYQLERRLAFGGMAEVYLGSVHGEAGFSKAVVIKRLHPRLNEDSEFVQMLIDEARITSQLAHSNICQVLDLGSVDDSYYIAMEFIAGEDLRTLQDFYSRNGEFVPVEAALYIVAEMLAGLDYAHTKEGPDGQSLGVIHRDVSPQNVLISYEGEVKVIDFGIAKAKSKIVQTQAGVIKGKFRYMSPEQASGQQLDARTDVFAAGVVLYELLRGRPHSVDVPDTEVLRRMRDAEFEPIERDRRDVPDQLLRLVSKALARKTRKRFASANEFRQAVLRYLQARRSTFGRSELAALMKTVFPLERRRERSGHSTTRRDPQAEMAQAPRGGSSRQAPPSRRAVSGEIGQQRRAAGLAMARTAHSDGAQPRGHHDPGRGLSPVPTGARTRSQRTGQGGAPPPPQPPPHEGTHQLDLEEVELVGQPQPSRAPRDDPRDYHATEHRAPPPAAYAEGAYFDGDISDTGEGHAPPHHHEGRGAPLERATRVEGTGRRGVTGRRGASGGTGRRSFSDPRARAREYDEPPQERYEPRGERRGGAFTRAAPVPPEQLYGAKQPRTTGGLQPAERSGTEHVGQQEQGGGGAGKLLLILLVLGALGGGGFYFGRAYLGFGGGAPRADSAVATRALDLGPPKRPDAAPKAKPKALGRSGRLQIKSTPAGAEIRLCGKSTGEVTPAALRIKRGRRCVLELRLAGHKPYRKRVRFPRKRRSPLTIAATLAPTARRPAAGTGGPKALSGNRGRLVVTSIQVGTVRINGRAVGRTPRLSVDLAPGRYTVSVSFTTLGTRSAPHSVTVERGKTKRVYISAEQ